MQLETAWVKPPRHITGQDHLGVQAPCINLYGKLLPGITNVTDRARYYSFYPWIVWALEQKGHVYNETFVDLFRKADCLFTFIAHQHAHSCGGDISMHSGACIGSNNLAKPLKALQGKSTVFLSDFSHQDPSDTRYFKNKLGGLGQYYRGVLAELDIMNGTTGKNIQNTKQIGNEVAQAFAQGVDGELFLKTLDENEVSVERLNALSTFCPCSIASNKRERELLFDCFFVRNQFSNVDLLPRRRTLQTMLHIADALANQKQSIDVQLFRSCVYSGALPDGSPLILPDRLSSNLQRWGIYQRNEVLSLAIQGLFNALLSSYGELSSPLPSSQAICDWFISTLEINHVRQRFEIDAVFDLLRSEYSGSLPLLANWQDPHHEIQQVLQIETLCGETSTSETRIAIIEKCITALFALASREQTNLGYGDFHFPNNYFQYYPINLRSFHYHCEHTWKNMKLKEWLQWLCHNWGIEAHLKVALRKLRGQSQSSFRIWPSDIGMAVVEPDHIPEAVFTTPRFRQAIQILQDIGALEKLDGCLQSTSLGIMGKELADA
ncbi:MAG: hypothetical protein ABIJ50_04725 [Pseudomonadota bacterium]